MPEDLNSLIKGEKGLMAERDRQLVCIYLRRMAVWWEICWERYVKIKLLIKIIWRKNRESSEEAYAKEM